jgi:hypothetical protein
MDISFSCSRGHALVARPHFAGKKIKCPKCQEIVTVPAAPEPDLPEVVAIAEPEPELAEVIEEADDYEVLDEERSERRRRRDESRDYEEDDYDSPRESKADKKRQKQEQLEKVNLGLNFHLWKYVCFVLGILLYCVALVLQAVPPLALLAVAVAGLLALASAGLGILGSIFCSWVPPKSGARVLIFLSLGFDGGSLFALLVAFPLGVIAGNLLGAGVAMVFLVLCLLFGCAGFALFMIFLKKLAYYVGDRDSGDEAISAMIAYLGITLGGPLGLFLLALILLRIPVVGFIALIVAYVGWLVLIVLTLFRILHVINNVRSQV